MKSLVLGLFLALFFPTACSLSSGAPAREALDYVRGELKAYESESVNDIFEATIEAFESSGFMIKSKKQDSFSAVVSASDAQSRDITVISERSGDEMSLIRIRVGLLGDAEFSRQILSEIRKKLR